MILTNRVRLGLALLLALAGVACGDDDDAATPAPAGRAGAPRGGTAGAGGGGVSGAGAGAGGVGGEGGAGGLGGAMGQAGAPPARATQLATGASHSCALVEGGEVRCWGSNGFSQGGDGKALGVPYAVSVERAPGEALGGVQGFALGDLSSCALVGGGEVSCWGSFFPSYGQTTPVPIELAGGAPLGGAEAVELGSSHACALLSGGAVYCWGDNKRGQLANVGVPDGTYQAVAAEVSPGVPMTGVVALALGAQHTCALLGEGKVSCWGDNLSGQLGDGSTSNYPSPVPVPVELSPGVPLNGVVSLRLGQAHSCAQTGAGNVYCWGANSFGQLGNGSPYDSYRPVLVERDDGSAISGAQALEVGSFARLRLGGR